MAANAADLLAETAQRDPDGVGLVHGGARLTWAALDGRVTAFARGSLARGLRRGDRVALVTSNRIELVVAHYGALRAGLVSVPINPTLTAHELAQRTHDTSPSIIVCDAGSEVAVREALMTNRLGTEGVVAVGSPAWGDLMRPDHPAAEPTSTDPESAAMAMFTVAAGGRARAAVLSHRALLASIDQLRSLDPAALTADDIVLLSLPLVHSYALNGVLALAVAMGATVVVERRADAVESLAVLEREGVTVVAGPPALYTEWAASSDLAQNVGAVRLMSLGQTPLAPAVADQLRTLTGRRVWEAYGMVQAASVITATDEHSPSGSAGRPLPGIELRLIDVDRVDVTEQGDPGQVAIRGANLFSGFWPDHGQAPDDEGWFATHDIAYLDDEGSLHLVDRRHDRIVVNGFSVFPQEVETVIESLDAVAECAVVGVDHPVTGQAVRAVVVPADGEHVQPDDVMALCTQQLARFKRPTIIDIVDELPSSLAAGRLRRGGVDVG